MKRCLSPTPGYKERREGGGDTPSLTSDHKGEEEEIRIGEEGGKGESRNLRTLPPGRKEKGGKR